MGEWYIHRKRNAEIVRRYNAGADIADIAADPTFRLTYSGVRSVLRGRVNMRKRGPKPKITPERIRECRDLGWNTKEIARSVGITPQSIRRIEHKARREGVDMA